MPGFDGSGPLGQGPMSGRARGFCALRINGKGRYSHPSRSMKDFMTQPNYFYRPGSQAGLMNLNLRVRSGSWVGKRNKIF